MSNLEAFRGWLASGRILLPGTAVPTSVHLGRALAQLCGAPVQGFDSTCRQVAAAIGEAEHYVFVLVDGLGMNLIDSLPAESFLRRGLALEMHSVFPSSTAPGITSLATGLWPAEHGLPAWFVYLREANLSAISLPFVERFSGRPLGKLGVHSERLFSRPALLASFPRDCALIMPASISDSVYTRYIAGGHPVSARHTLTEAVDAVLTRIRHAAAPTFTYVYHASVDAAEHDHGPDSPQTAATVHEVEAGLSRLAAELPNGGRLVVSADHGQYLAPESVRFIMRSEDPLLELLACPPTGEGRLPIFHVRPGHTNDFRGAFLRRYGDHFLLLSRAEIAELRLFGPEALSNLTLDRIGDFIGVPVDDEVLVYEPSSPMVGYHGGLSQAEVSIPLIVA
ncbi:MAG TPA: alkaline phosphatase family protein [Dehalococcoidia bacterium]|jgi:hypothetical protein